jgi:TPP-dependent indolepyruvate ferredoxin oxidoreductase alpha subunit
MRIVTAVAKYEGTALRVVAPDPNLYTKTKYINPKWCCQAHVYAIVGDGGFLMNGAQELLTAIQHKLHITILVL